MRGRARRWRRRRCVLLALAALVAVGAGLVAASGAALGETGAPALEPDGVWRARGDWVVEAGESVVHESRTVEVYGNLTLADGASLAMANVSLVLSAAGNGSHEVALATGSRLALDNTTVDARGPADVIRATHATVDAARCSLRFAHGPAVPSALNLSFSQANLTDCTMQSDAAHAVHAVGGQLTTLDCDFLTRAGVPAPVFVEAPTRAVFDTTRFGALDARGGPFVTGYATVRFFLFDLAGAPQAGRVNGTGPYSEEFSVLTSPNATAAVRLKWFEFVAAPDSYTPEQRAGQLVTFTALAQGVGANNSRVPIAAHRTNVTVALTGRLDLAVASLTLYGGSLTGPSLRRAYFLDLNESYAVLLRVENRGVERSPPVRFALTQAALKVDSWQPYEWRPPTYISIQALDPGESAAMSVPFVAGPYGGFKDDSGPCFTSVSYLSSLRLELADNVTQDYAAWNNAREFNVVAFEVTGDTTGQCTKPGVDILPLLAAGGAAAVGAVAVVSWRFSEHRALKRAASEEPNQAPASERGGGPPRAP